jgi:hypothetical protein
MKLANAISGIALANALRATQATVKVILAKDLDPQGNPRRASLTITPQSALLLLKSSTWIGLGTPTRIKKLIERDTRPRLPWLSCYRTNGSPSVPYFYDESIMRAGIEL